MHPPPRRTLFPYTTLFRSLTRWFCRATAHRWSSTTRRDSGAPGNASGASGGPASISALANPDGGRGSRSEEHTSELQSRLHLVCRLLLEKRKARKNETRIA